jgi:hypothetical protein
VPAMPAGAMAPMRTARRVGAGGPKMQRMSHQAMEHPAARADVDPLADARAQAAEEAQRLAAFAGSELDRRDVLDDLASRLDALARHLDSLGVDPGAVREIVDMLRDEMIPATERWDRARRALAEFAAGDTARRPFWKRQ